jgi:hypothetical protein
VPDPNNPDDTITVTVPLAANDSIRVYATLGQELDVLANDAAAGCNDVSDGTLTITRVNDGSVPATTAQGGTVSIGSGGLNVVYDPPSNGVCGIDFFEYSIEIVDPNGGSLDLPTATVWLIPQPVGGEVFLAPEFAGACCLPNGTCVDVTEPCCEASGGVWYGSVGPCGAAGIPCPLVGTVNPCFDPATMEVWPASYLEPPFPAVPPSLDPCSLDVLPLPLPVSVSGGAVVAVGWNNVEARVVDVAVTQPEELLMRFWFATVPGGPPDDFVDVRPFADPASTEDCGPDAATSFDPITGLAGPSSGLCELDLPRYVPTQDGVTEVLVQLLVDFDEVPAADACWIGGGLTVYIDDNGGFGDILSVGACCVGGLCIETNPYECATLAGDWGIVPDPFDDSYWQLADGFFAGVGTSCDDIDWCRPTAPCCYLIGDDRYCDVLTGDDCWLVGTSLGNPANLYGVWPNLPGDPNGWGTIGWDMGTFVDATELDGTPIGSWNPPDPAGTPAWGLGCDFPVCSSDSSVVVPTAACCVRTDTDVFCTDLTEEACDNYASATGWTTSWSIRGFCEQVPCSEYGGVSWQGPLGACCWESSTGSGCVDGMTFSECMETYLTPNPPGSPSDPVAWVTFNQGLTCGDGPCQNSSATGACCMSLDSFCCLPDVEHEVCQAFGGTWLGGTSTCASCVERTAKPGVCCLGGMACTADLDFIRCGAAGGTWHPEFTSCSEGLPCYGVTGGVGISIGVCCYEYECVDATTFGLQDINEDDCILGGGRWIGTSDTCATIVLGACDPKECIGVLSSHVVSTFDDATCANFGGTPVVPLGDVNGDGHVGGLPDLIPMIEQWGEPSSNADLDDSGHVDVPDLLILLTNWE